jgi:prevent-host-death family protein
METLPFSEARAHLADALRRVESGHEPVLISRRGQGAGVLMSFEQYQGLNDKADGFTQCLERWRATYLPLAVDADGADPFSDVRQADAARDFSW